MTHSIPAFIGGTGPGGFELLIFFSAILMLFGAKRVPEFARTVGRMMEELRRASSDFKSQLMEAGDEIKRDLPDFTKELSDDTYARDEFHDDIAYDDAHHDAYHDDPDHYHDEQMDDYARDPYYQSDYSGDYDPYALKEEDPVGGEQQPDPAPDTGEAAAAADATAAQGPVEEAGESEPGPAADEPEKP